MTTARARRSDPPTSHEAAYRVESSGVAARQAKQILEHLRHHPGLTSAELAEASDYYDRYQTARRLPELQFAGLVDKGEIRVCGVSGKRAVTWWPTEAQERML